jgi:hypothetical protein
MMDFSRVCEVVEDGGGGGGLEGGGGLAGESYSLPRIADRKVVVEEGGDMARVLGEEGIGEVGVRGDDGSCKNAAKLARADGRAATVLAAVGRVPVAESPSVEAGCAPLGDLGGLGDSDSTPTARATAADAASVVGEVMIIGAAAVGTCKSTSRRLVLMTSGLRPECGLG